MYCLKCKQSFEEGSRRFCPSDGSRLVPDTAAAGGRRDGGIFANLIPKIEGISDLEETLSNYPRPVIETTDAPQASQPMDEVFFELDDIDIKDDRAAESGFVEIAPLAEAAAPSPEPRPAARKVNPYEIPAGHVDLADTERLAGLIADFDENDPENFLGQTVKGRYKITEYLGGDEAGLAYLADDRIVADRKVLVRVLLDGESDEIMSSLLAEERISLSHLSHPNIARLIDSGEFNNGISFLVSEYVDALSVADILGIHGAFNEQRAARVIKQAAAALSEAHQEGILHRDIRPDNIIIDSTGGDAETIKLVNFGTSTGAPTPANIGYKATEVLDGRIATIASDIYSLAVVAYEMLTGSLPFSGETEREVTRAQSAGLKVRPTDLRPGLPDAVNDVLGRAFSANMADRYPKARDLGDALYAALVEPAAAQAVPVESPATANTQTLQPLAVAAERSKPEKEAAPVAVAPEQPAWKNRSPEPPQDGTSRSVWLAAAGIMALLAVLGVGWYYVANTTPPPDVPPQSAIVASDVPVSPAIANTEMPPQPRNIPQPPNTSFYQNSKQNLKGDLLRNFVGFTLYYPKEWKVNDPQAGEAGSRGHFLDISRATTDVWPEEQMLVSYYPSKGTYAEDAGKFPELVKETNDTLKKLLRDYKMVSEGETRINGEWKAYEIKFEGSGTSGSGGKLTVWGRRLFIPAARPGVRNGFEITMIATSLGDDINSVDDLGVRGELASILYSFEPSQNF